MTASPETSRNCRLAQIGGDLRNRGLADAYKSFCQWCEDSGHKAMSKHRLSREIGEMIGQKSCSVRVWDRVERGFSGYRLSQL